MGVECVGSSLGGCEGSRRDSVGSGVGRGVG